MARARAAHVLGFVSVLFVFVAGVLAVPTALQAQATPPSEADQARMQSQAVVGLRRCLTDEHWSIAVDAVFLANGRVRFDMPASGTWTAAQRACLARAAGALRPARRVATEQRVSWTVTSSDPRPLLLRSIDVARCIPTFEPCRCHIVAAVALSARRPGRMAAATFDVHECVVDPTQLQCLEQAVAALRFPVHPRDAENFRGPVGTTCHE